MQFYKSVKIAESNLKTIQDKAGKFATVNLTKVLIVLYALLPVLLMVKKLVMHALFVTRPVYLFAAFSSFTEFINDSNLF